MKFKVLASGSGGNCTYLELGDIKILIDVGISYLQIKNILLTDDIDINDINYILITHLHNDHIKGLSSTLKKTNIKLLIPTLLVEDISKIVDIKDVIMLDEVNIINKIKIELIHISHDVIAYGYLIKYDDKTLVYITDTGYIN